MPVSSKAPRRRTLSLAGLGAALLLAGCGTTTGNIWGDYFQLLKTSMSASMGNQRITRDQAAAIPYASLAYRVNGGNQQLLVLATDTNGELIWTAASHVVLTIRQGRIVRTVGLPRDRAGLNLPGTIATLPPLADALKASYRSTRLVDLPALGVYGASLSCVTTARGAYRVTIIGTTLSTVRVDETCQSRTPHWSFTDSYWLDRTSGFVWRSAQNVHPGVVVETEILRPPG